MWGSDASTVTLFVTAKTGYRAKVDPMSLLTWAFTLNNLTFGVRRHGQLNPSFASTATKMTRANAVLLGLLGRAEHRSYILV